uniref:Uncharacterized protein n=1 Tax=Clytia hemisphaerica TaxID=252671 RepID=A0A7M5V581_9CNID
PVCKTGWERVPNADDLSTVAFVIRARNWRNWITHEPASEVNESVFETKWNEGCYIAHGLGYKSFDQHSLKQKALKKSEVMDPAHFYQMTSDPRGFCIIINNSFLSTVETRDGILLSQRNGTDVDGKAIEKLFGWLQFKVETKENVGRSQMLKILRDYALDDRNVNHDCLVICILSHGYEKGIYCNDGQEMDFAEMREYFNGKNCPNLNGKPKLFYIQACQGSGKAEESHITDGPPSLSLKSDPVSPGLQEGATVSASDKEPSPPPSSLAHYADFSFFVAATPGTVSYRNARGTWFIQELCNVFTENAKTYSLSMLRQKVNSKIAERFQKLPKSKGVAKMMSDGGLDTLRKEIRFGPKKSYQKYLEEDEI